MKTKRLLAVFATSFIIHTSAHAQGALTPPVGTPAPVMKSLDQIEARTAITNRTSLVTLSQSGSYYLTGNLTVSAGDGIDITTNGVTLDLNGFTIRSTAASATGFGILITNGNLVDITIYNGHIRGSVTNNGSGVYGGGGFANGIYSPDFPQNVQVSCISVFGCLNHGIYLNIGNSTAVEACTVRTMGGYGIYASIIKNCVARDCGNTAIRGQQVSDCRGDCSSDGDGIFATTAQNCYGSSIGGYGVRAEAAAQNCYGYSVTFPGVLAELTATGCSGYSSSSFGLWAIFTATGCHGSSTSGTGLKATTANNCTGNRAGGRAIEATVANGCYANLGTNLITYKYNMP